MSLQDVLKPTSFEKQANLKKRGFIESSKGRKWKFQISIAKILQEYNENSEDTKIFKEALKEILNNKLEDVKIYLSFSNDDAESMVDYEEIIDELNMLDEHPESSELDYVLSLLYDFGDNNDIWINSFEE